MAFNQLVELKITRYIDYSVPITTPIDGRNSHIINENFKFNDMKDLFKPTLRMTDHIFTPAIEYYFESLEELVESLEELVKLGYIHRWPEIQNLCLSFIGNSKELDFSAYILNQPKTKIGDVLGSDFDVEMIEKHEGEVKYLQSNSINAYVALYNLIHESYKFIKAYRAMASEIIETK